MGTEIEKFHSVLLELMGWWWWRRRCRDETRRMRWIVCVVPFWRPKNFNVKFYNQSAKNINSTTEEYCADAKRGRQRERVVVEVYFVVCGSQSKLQIHRAVDVPRFFSSGPTTPPDVICCCWWWVRKIFVGQRKATGNPRLWNVNNITCGCHFATRAWAPTLQCLSSHLTKSAVL